MAAPKMMPVSGLLGGAATQQPGSGPAPADAKNARSQDVSGGVMSTLAGGEPLSRAMGHYKKGHSFNPAPGIRAGGGGIRPAAKQGGLGPGRMSAPGTSADYSMTSPDQE